MQVRGHLTWRWKELSDVLEESWKLKQEVTPNGSAGEEDREGGAQQVSWGAQEEEGKAHLMQAVDPRRIKPDQKSY